MKKYSMLLLVFAIYALPAFGQDNLNTTRIGVWPYGPGNVVALHNDNVFLSHGRAIQIYEYADPDQPQLLGEVFMDDMIQVMAFDNNTAFVAGYKWFHILDISNATQPVIVSSFYLQSRANAICLSSGYVYLALNNTGIMILDISELQNPAMVAFYQTYQANLDLVIQNNVAWMVSGYSGLTAYDLSNPVSPVPFYSYNESGSMQSVAVQDSLLYTTNSSSGIMVFDISNLQQIQLLSTTPTFSLGTNLHIDGNLLAVSMLHQGFFLYDISEPAAPDSLCWYYAGWPNRNTVLKDGLAFHCHSFEFSIVDISNPDEMILTAHIGLSDIAQYAHYWENHLFINSFGGSVMTVDVSDPQQAVKVAQLDGGDGHSTIHVNDDLLFTNRFKMLEVYDVSNPSEPVFLNTLEASATISSVLKQDHLLFVGDNNGLHVFDVSDIFSPELLGVFSYGGIERMIAHGHYLYCTRFWGFFILDFSDPTNLTQASNIENMLTTSIAVKDTLAYVVSSNYPQIAESSLKIFNIKNPASVFLITSRDQGRHFEDVTLCGDYLYVYEQYVGLQIYDTREVYPVLCGFFSFNRHSLKMATNNGITYLPLFAGFDIVQNDFLTSVENIFISRSERLNIFPNPAHDVINFGLDADNPAGVFTWEIIQINGAGANSGALTAGQQQISLDGLPAGVYVLHLQQSGEKYKSGLFVIQ
jgi:hypothetical protein